MYGQERERDEEDDFGVGRDDDDTALSVRTIVHHEEQLAKQEWEEEQRRQDNEDEKRGGLSSGDPGSLSLRAWASPPCIPGRRKRSSVRPINVLLF